MIPELVLLDRDGTINVPAAATRYVTAAQEVRLLPGAGRAIRALNDAHVRVVVVTNQRGLATGDIRPHQLAEVNAAISDQLEAVGAHVDGWYVCPHDEGQCQCRKPRPGLVLRALSDNPRVDPRRCVIVGDAETDVLAGRAAGVPSVRLSPDPGVASWAGTVLPDLDRAVRWLLGSGGADPDEHAATDHPDHARRDSTGC